MNAVEERTAQDLLKLVAKAAPAALAPSDLAERVLIQSRSRRRRHRITAGVGALVLTGAVAAAALPDRGDYARFYQPSGAMAPTVAVGQTVVLRKDAVPVRGDVVRITVRNAGEPFEMLSRVIGLPGDVVMCPDDGHGRCAAVVVSGKALHEPFLTEATQPFGPVTVGPGQVFVLGDARKAANDSRYLGPQRLADVKGAAVARVEANGTLTRLPGAPDRPLPGEDDTVDPLGPIPPSREAPVLGE